MPTGANAAERDASLAATVSERCSCTGVILAGGAARRFGGAAKGLQRVGERRLVDRVAHALRQVTDGLLVVSAHAEASRWLHDAPVITEPRPGAGPLAAIVAALEHTGWPVLVTAWDMPFLSPALLGELRRLGESGTAAAVVPTGAEGRPEPLCAWYGPACTAPFAAMLADGRGAVHVALQQVGALRLPASRVLDWGDPARLFFSVNDADGLATAERMASVEWHELG